MKRNRVIRSLKTQSSVLALVLLGSAAAAPPEAPKQGETSQLHAAAVPVRPLVHQQKDPTEAFPEQFPMQIAVYWTNPSEGVLGIVHSLREMGIPFFVTRDFTRALAHRLIIIYPSVDGRTFTADQVDELTRHMRSGGSLFAVNVVARGLGALFGFSDVAPSRQRYKVNFSAGLNPTLRYLNRPEELQVSLGATKHSQIFWTNGYRPDETADVLAHFEDGSAAVLRKTWGKGAAYLCGLSFHDVVVRNQVNRDFDAERHYVNAFEPGADVWMLLLRAWYETAEPAAVAISTVPSGQRSVVLLSHDVDWENSFTPALSFAKSEANLQTHRPFSYRPSTSATLTATPFFMEIIWISPVVFFPAALRLEVTPSFTRAGSTNLSWARGMKCIQRISLGGRDLTRP